jgi:hypothetical protein
MPTLRLALAPFLALAAAIAAACSGEPAAAGGAAAADPLAAVPKDGAKPWRVDEHTRRSAAAMLEAAAAAPAPADAAAAQALAGRLDALLAQLIAGCTLEGPGHEALHLYLGALMSRLDGLRGGEPAAAARAHQEVVAILRRFPEFFA